MHTLRISDSGQRYRLTPSGPEVQTFHGWRACTMLTWSDILLMTTEPTINGMTYAQAHYNVYAFTQDVKRFTRKRDNARKPHTKARWEKQREEAQRYVLDNQQRLQAFETA